MFLGPECFINRRRESVEKAVPARHREPARSGEAGGPPGNPAVPRDWIRGVLEQYVAGSDTRGRPEGRPYPRSQQAIHETSGPVPD